MKPQVTNHRSAVKGEANHSARPATSTGFARIAGFRDPVADSPERDGPDPPIAVTSIRIDSGIGEC
ncbi:hypothetical protein IU485_04495 [Nocardia cyriacigeorgica]|nr:hypothetical protein [Nocardia cyriacigeorgica]MBF6080613.1 hypothetical protein [Nocardia cyriacigeorgica]